ncbi:MAG: transposase [Cytophagaceae bacterium]|nr:transposase [Cytophagaceae bacterium]
MFGIIDRIRNSIANELVPFRKLYDYGVDAIEVCKLSRATRSKICTEEYRSAPDKGCCASQKMHFYGYKLHTVSTTLKGVFKSFEITKEASVHSIHYLKNIKQEFENCTIIGDKGYLSVL